MVRQVPEAFTVLGQEGSGGMFLMFQIGDGTFQSSGDSVRMLSRSEPGERGCVQGVCEQLPDITDPGCRFLLHVRALHGKSSF